MDPGPDATIFPFGVFEKADPSRLNALERKSGRAGCDPTLECFRQKWTPVLPRKARQDKTI
jgi:hypothetical protein